MDRQTIEECMVYIAVAEACHREKDPSHSWHVFTWLCWKQNCRLPLRRGGPIITFDACY